MPSRSCDGSRTRADVIALAIIIGTAATLHKAGVSNIQNSTQAAGALKPIASALTFLLFALGIVGTGLLAIPLLAGSAAYAVGEPADGAQQPKRTVAFYSAIVAAAVLGGRVVRSLLAPFKLGWITSISAY